MNWKLPTILVVFLFSTGLYAQFSETGIVHYYADYLEGQKTASGETYQGRLFTAAHRTLPYGTLVKVTRLDNGRSTVVRINDRGPYNTNGLIDISKAAAMQLDLIRDGMASVRIELASQSGNSTANSTQLAARTPAGYDNTGAGRLTAKSPAATRAFIPYTPDEGFQTNGQLFENKTAVSNVSPEYPKPVASSYEFTDRGVSQGNGRVSLPNQYDVTAKSPAVETTQPLSGLSGYGIQLASYQEYSNASRQVKALQAQGMDQLFLFEGTNSKGVKLFRVVHGPFSSYDAAEQRKEALRSQFLQDGLVIKLVR